MHYIYILYIIYIIYYIYIYVYYILYKFFCYFFLSTIGKRSTFVKIWEEDEGLQPTQSPAPRFLRVCVNIRNLTCLDCLPVWL